MQNERGIGRMERASGAIQGQGEGERGQRPGAGMHRRLLAGAVLLALSSASWAGSAGGSGAVDDACAQDIAGRAVACGQQVRAIQAAGMAPDAAAASQLDATPQYVATTPAAADIGTADAVATGWGAVAIGSNAVADTNQYGTAVGAGSHAAGYSSLALGTSAATGSSAFGSVAIGLNAVANDTQVVSFGHAAGDSVYLAGDDRTIVFSSEQARRLIHVAAGIDATDAVNKGQLDAAVAGVAAGSAYLAVGLANDASFDGAATASANNTTALGSLAKASGAAATAVGQGALAAGIGATALGQGAQATTSAATAIGQGSQATAAGSLAIGVSSIASQGWAVTIGEWSSASGLFSTATGTLAQASGASSSAYGGFLGTGSDNIEPGRYTLADGAASAAFGAAAHAMSERSAAFGANSQVASTAAGSAAFGADAVATQAGVVSFGHAATDTDNLGTAYGSALTRRLANVADGIDASDAATVGQLDAAVDSVSGSVANAVSYAAADKGTVMLAGSGGTVIGNLRAGDISSAASTQAVNGGQLYATNQAVQANAATLAGHGTRLDNDEDSLADHETRLVQDRGDIDAATAGIGTINQTAVFYTDATRSQVQFGAGGAPVRLSNVAAGTAATDAVNKAQLDAVASQAGQTEASAVKYDDAARGEITLAGGSGTAIHNLAAGSAAGDAVNKGQLDAVSGQVTAVGQRVDQVSQQVNANTAAIGQLDGRVGTLEGQVGALQQSTVTLTHVAVDGNTDGSDMATVQAGSHGVAVGANATAGGDHGTAIGGDSYAAGANDTALGGNAQVHADGSTAVGANTAVAAAATNAVAMGEGATVGAASGTALGQGSSVTAKGAVALGQGAVANQGDTVSVGNATQQRRIVNVAAGTAGTDAVNVSQLDAGVQSAIDQGKAYSDANDIATLNSAKAYADQRFANASQQFDQFRDDVDRRFNTIDTRIDRLNAMGAASTQMAINAAGSSGNGRLAAGVGFSGGRAAVSVGYGAPLGERTHISFGATSSGSESSGGIGFGVDL